ncbi:SUMF1/EgtB/PvdO family nonheme iron enzyme, partial [Acinetobacter calcoaceticus]|uniref:SUMF1/EgtB/PvdO family nonheme iron enzyme n=1 Tax=Acinetobacter calcoaceticus TaxID=471 RepID=UPI0018DE40CC
SILQQFPATPLGLYDMITDNYEWMLDWYDPLYYSKSSEKNPQGPKTGTLKVVRSSEPSDGQNLQMFGGFTFSRHALHPIEDPKLSNDPDIKKYNIDLNRLNSVRCAINY